MSYNFKGPYVLEARDGPCICLLSLSGHHKGFHRVKPTLRALIICGFHLVLGPALSRGGGALAHPPWASKTLPMAKLRNSGHLPGPSRPVLGLRWRMHHRWCPGSPHLRVSQIHGCFLPEARSPHTVTCSWPVL